MPKEPNLDEKPFVLHLFDRRTRSEHDVISLPTVDVGRILERFDIDPELLVRHAWFELEPEDIAWLNASCGLAIDGTAFHVKLGRLHESDLPYKLHTRRELRMMLDGIKPLAVFVDAAQSAQNQWIFPKDVFAPHVDSGLLVMREYCQWPRSAPHETVVLVLLYARAVEAWRIDAFISMREAAEASGWSDGFERLEGTLLGYTCWQNDPHLQSR